jgi:hypothetical protein
MENRKSRSPLRLMKNLQSSFGLFIYKKASLMNATVPGFEWLIKSLESTDEKKTSELMRA